MYIRILIFALMILETNRLLLTKQTEADAHFVLELMNSDGWLKYIGDRGVATEEDAEDYIRNGAIKSYATHGFGLYLVKLRDGDKPVGLCGLIKRDALEHVDIGFAFLPEYNGHGYATEAATGVMEYAKTVLGLKTIAGITMPDNLPSIAVLKMIGLTYKEMVQLPGDGEELMLFEWNG